MSARLPPLPETAGEPAAAIADLDDAPSAPSVVSIGFFDGVHRGHRSIIGRAAKHAEDAALRSVIATFDRHPAEVISPGSQPELLMSPERRVHALAAQGVDLVAVVPFDDELRHAEPESFVDRVLVSALQARHVVVGANFRFGHKAAGDVAALADLGPVRGFRTEGVSLLTDDGEPISSTAVRRAVEAGAVERAAQLLGRPHFVDGLVERGNARGAGLGFPTANLAIDQRVAVPARGIYAGYLHIAEGTAHPCVTSVGVNPTFGGQTVRVEAHLIDFTGDLYGAAAAVDFRSLIRTEETFDDADALVAQMHADTAEARRRLGLV